MTRSNDNITWSIAKLTK